MLCSLFFLLIHPKSTLKSPTHLFRSKTIDTKPFKNADFQNILNAFISINIYLILKKANTHLHTCSHVNSKGRLRL